MAEVWNIRERIVGWEKEVPLATGGTRRYVYLDNAASTPAFTTVREKVDEFIGWYSSIHRGAGFKSTVATYAYEQARGIILDFVGADADTHTAVFCVNTTEAINKLACCLEIPEGSVILVSPLEHHSNDLPWRRRGELAYLPLDSGGCIDLPAAERLVGEISDRLALIAVTGASNITGQLMPIHELAKIAHANGVRILVDAAQLAPHVAIEMEPRNPGAHLDYIAFAGHKMYAPYGGAALIARNEALESCGPACLGGGTVKMVTRDEVIWAETPDLLEAGTPNVVGAVALATAAKILKSIGFTRIHNREKELTKMLLEGMLGIPDIVIYGPADPDDLDRRLGAVTFDLGDMPHQLVAAVLSYEGGIGVRNGCFCAHPLILDLQNLKPDDIEKRKEEILACDRRRVPGMVRVSLGIYNDEEDIRHFLAELDRLARKGPRLKYVQDKNTGAFSPENYAVDPGKYLSL